MSEKRMKLFPNFTIKQLKLICLIALFIYSFGIIVIQNGYLKLYLYTPEQINELVNNNQTIFNLMQFVGISQIIGGFCVPIYAFFVVEGYKNTRNYWHYLRNLTILALLSELPYNLAMHHSLFFPQAQNPIFALVFCLLLLKGLDYMKNMAEGWKLVFSIFITISAVCWIATLNIDFGLGLVLISTIYYCFDSNKLLKHLLAGIISILYVSGPIALYVLVGYNNEKGNIKNKWFFYALYPIHLLVFTVISYII